MIHPTAEVALGVRIGEGTRIWHQAQVREGVMIGHDCVIGKGVYVDRDVVIGNNVKVQNYALLYHGATIEDGVFIGPQACLANDRLPRSITPDGRLKSDEDWTVGPIVIRFGASVGAGAIVLPNVTVGRFAMVAARALVTRSVPEYGLAIGAPARLAGFVCRCGRRLTAIGNHWICQPCDWTYQL
jgi:acetyltransferase-like isoleucine patch superfamily enzyme